MVCLRRSKPAAARREWPLGIQSRAERSVHRSFGMELHGRPAGVAYVSHRHLSPAWIRQLSVQYALSHQPTAWRPGKRDRRHHQCLEYAAHWTCESHVADEPALHPATMRKLGGRAILPTAGFQPALAAPANHRDHTKPTAAWLTARRSKNGLGRTTARSKTPLGTCKVLRRRTCPGPKRSRTALPDPRG